MSRHLVGAVVLLALAAAAAAPQPVPSRHVLHRAEADGWTLAVTAEMAATGPASAVLEASSGARRVYVSLDAAPAWRVARRVSAVRVHAASDRALVLTDQAQDASGLIVVDLRAGRVVSSLIGRHLALSPDARYVAFEEYFTRLDTPWPWNETVYAVLDVTASAERSHRSCPYDDDRCGGRLIHLPSRQEVCATHRERLGGGSCLMPGRDPQFERRSPFVWLDAATLAFVSVDRVRETFVVVEARFDPAVPLGADASAPGLDVVAHSCTPAAAAAVTARCPPVRTPWAVDAIRQDDGDRRLWIHFRNRMPEVPGGWLPVAPP